MGDYSDLISLIGAIIIYGLLLTGANRALVVNNQKLTDSEVEYGAISAAQDVIEKARWIKYDNISKSSLETFAKNKLATVGNDKMYKAIVDISSISIDGSAMPSKKISVKIKSDYLTNADGSSKPLTMSLIKTKF